MAFVNCAKCEYSFEEEEKFCPRCETLYVKDAYVKTGPVSGLPYAEKPTKASQPAALNLPKFQATKTRHNYGPQPDEMPKPRSKMNVDAPPPEYKKSSSGKILGGLIILIVLVVIYYMFIK